MKRSFSSSILNILIILGGLPCLAQSVHVLPGDVGFSPSFVWPSPSLQWAQSFTYTSPTLQPGRYLLTFKFQEPTVNGPGQRVFTVTWPGGISLPLDLWKINKTGFVTLEEMLVVYNTPTTVLITFAASVRNAVISSLDIVPLVVVDYGSSFLSDPDQIQDQPCPTAWTGPRLPDGNCIIFSTK